jgi:DNA-binding LacI/PurR family transcriptional regulator
MRQAAPGTTSIADVARLAGVSTATVSRVLNHPDIVRGPTRDRVRAALERTGFLPNAIAQSLAARRSRTIGVIIPTITNPILADSTRGIAEVLDAHGYHLLIATTDNEPARETAMIRTFLERRFDGLVLTGVGRDAEAERLLRAGGRPYVTVWEYDRRPGRATVSFDNQAAARAMTEALLGLGHRRIGFVPGPLGTNDRSRARLRGYRAALAAAGVPDEPALVHETEFTFDNGRRAMARFLAMTPAPTAVFFVSDILAIGALLECAERSVAVPGTVSIAGFDDLDLSRHVRPALSTIRVPTHEMGRLAAELLLDVIGGGPRRKRLLDTEVVLRASTGPPP